MQKHGLAMCMLLCLGLGARTAGAADLAKPCPIDWRGVPLGQAVRELADRLDVAYILDPSVTQEVLGASVRLTAVHLNGRQAFRWTARAAGLDAVVVEGVVVIGRADRLPRVWRLSGSIPEAGPAGSRPSPDDADSPTLEPRAGEFRNRRVDLAWLDAPLSRVRKDISDRFGIDLVFHARILEQQRLVRLEGPSLGWDDVENALGQQLDAVAEYDDGVIRVEPRPATSRPADPPAGSDPTTLAATDSDSVLFRPVEISFAGGNARNLGETLSRAAGINCRVEAPEGTQWGPISARGSLLEILEAARILEGWECKITAADGPDGSILLIRTGGSGRSVP